MGVINLVSICSLSVCVLLCSLSFLYAANCPLDLLDISWLWAVDLQAYFTPPVSFFMLNLVMGALFLINSGFFNSHEAFSTKKALKQPSSTGTSSIPSSGTARGFPPKPGPQKQLGRSKSDKQLPAAMAGTSMKSSSSSKSAAGQADSQADQSMKKKKKKGSSSSVDQGENADSENVSALKKASSAPPQGEGEGNGEVDEVDQRAEDFIGKFYLQMKMQRVESMQRYNQRMDRSYGR